uniref:Kelch domain containing 7A n=1 Tax=Knipowitschia caucasica TaxID=637954 RepID=A0AAV2M7K4_KNICA
MPIADLVGVQFDMQLLVRLSLSVAVVLLGSWAYKFYSSRNDKKRLLCCNKNGTCRKCNATLGLPDDVDGELKGDEQDGVLEKSKDPKDNVKGENVFNPAHSDNSVKDDTLNLHSQPALSTSNISFGTSLKLPHPAECGMANATGRLSPCFLQRLEGSVGVGRELRQDSERQGGHCSFLSKAEIKVEDASLLTEGTGDQVVRGKIYDYYVESSSHSVTESRESKLEVASGRSSVGESVSFMNTIVMRDLVSAQSYDQDFCAPLGKLKPRNPARPALQRNQSYQSAAEQSELVFPPPTSKDATPDCVESVDGMQPSSAIYYYDDYKDIWQKLCQIPPEVVSKACALCTLDNYLYLALGCQRTGSKVTPSKRVFCFNPLTSIWKEISPLIEARPRCKLAALDGCIYAIGGECLSSVERYDPRLDRWAFVAPLPNDTFAVAHHVAVCDGDIFVSGGTLRCLLLRYNPQANSWKASLIGSKERTADMVAVGRFLYRFDANPLLGLSVYRYHTVARLWYECSSKRVPRCPAFQCVAMYGSIFCVNRQFTMRFDADEVSPAFADEDLSVLSAAKGMLFPFVLSLPDKKPRQTSV